MKRLALILGLLLLASSAFAQANNTIVDSDNFASGSLAAGWGTLFGDSKCQVIVGPPNYTEPNGTVAEAGQIWASWSPSEQVSEVNATVTSEANTVLELFVRWQSGAYTGYRAQMSNGTALINRFTDGSATQLGSTVTGLTFAAHDVWSMQAAGSMLILYRNQIKILAVFDATYTTGSVGYAQYSAVSITHNKVYSWSGYNNAQQEGIWQKQGITIPAIAADLASTGVGTWQPSQILYEGNAQILSGTVYKVWFTGGPGTGPEIYYAESLDGINWTRYPTAVIANGSQPQIMEVGGTYYLYYQPSPIGTSDWAVSTGTDGIHWTQQSTTVLALGGAGTWDSGEIWSFYPTAIISGTWYGLYGGVKSTETTAFQSQTGLATSSDGITWTKYAGNPVIAASSTVPFVQPSAAIVNVGGTYYGWFDVTNPSPRYTGAGNGLDPTEAARFYSTDFIHWTGPVHSFGTTQMFEDLNGTDGQAYISAIINVNGQAYAYTNSSPADVTSTLGYQIGLAIAPAPINRIVALNEDAVTQVAADLFTSGTGNLSANWTTPTGLTKLQIVSGPYVECTSTSVICGMAYTATTFSNQQYSQVTIQTLDSGQFANPCVFMQTGANSYYTVAMAGATGGLGNLTGSFVLQATIGGTNTTFVQGTTATIQVGDVIRLSVTQNANGFNVLSLYQNGYLLLQVVDTADLLTSGYPGMRIYSPTAEADAQISAWAGGNAGTIPPYSLPSLSNGAKLSNGTLTQ